MSELSRAQKVRLGVFLAAALGIAVAAILAKVGGALFDAPDPYHVRVPDAVGGLVPGADVTYNGIVVGKVAAIGVDPYDVAMVRLDLELREGTPVPENAKALVVLTGITGTRRVDLVGGTNGVRLRRPGEEIPAGRGFFDALVEKAERVSDRIDQLGERMNRLASDDNIVHLEATLANVERASAAVAGLLEDSRPRVASLMASAEATSREVAATLDDVRHTLKNLDGAVDSAERIVTREVGPLLGDARGVVKRIDGFVTRAETFVARVDGAIGRTQGDIGRVLAELADGIESISDLATMLKRDPSSLVNGKSWAGR